MVKCLLNGRPYALHVFVFFESLQELADLAAVFVGEVGEHLGDVTDFTGDDGPAVGAQPRRGGMDGGAVGMETGATSTFGDVVVLRVANCFKVVGTRFDGGGFKVDAGGGRMRFYDTHMLK